MGLSDFIEEWRDVPASIMSDHGTECCSRARLWFESMDRTQLADASRPTAPLWLGNRFAWGPHPWPMHWCEAARRDQLDCGALAGIAWHLMRERGADAVHVQLIERFNAQNVKCWAALWERAGLLCEWAAGRLVYHEAVGVIDDGVLRIWDPTDSRWLEPDDPEVYGAAMAIRITSPDRLQPAVIWGERTLPTGSWVRLDEAQTDLRSALPIDQPNATDTEVTARAL